MLLSLRAARPRLARSARPLRRRWAGARDGLAPLPAEDPRSRRNATPLYNHRSGLAGGGRPTALSGSVAELPGAPGHPRPVAPRAPAEAARAPLPSARTSCARSLDQEPHPSAGPGELPVGLPQDPGRALEARHRRLGHDDRHCPSTGTEQRRLGHRRAHGCHPRLVASEPSAHVHGSRSTARVRDSGSAGCSSSRRARDGRLKPAATRRRD